MKKYVCPLYSAESIEVNDIILLSLGSNAIMEEISETEAKVSVSALDVLGIR
ncbi:MAG: hypothetical protein J6D23_03440 [Clostridia bacterium]|nr:hypothetical protein [Clostridia bacterium]